MLMVGACVAGMGHAACDLKFPVNECNSAYPCCGANCCPGALACCTTDVECGEVELFVCNAGNCDAREPRCNPDLQDCAFGTCVTIEGVPACTPTCGVYGCPPGYGCVISSPGTPGVCATNPSPCHASSDCVRGGVCVYGRCVAQCGEDGFCDVGLRCLDGGCVVDRSTMATAIDGGSDANSSSD